jgi:hypothetical protein
MRLWKISKAFFGVSVLSFAVLSVACTEQPTTTTTNTNTPAPNVNASPTTNANAVPATADLGIDTREPDKYRATYVLSAQTTGNQTSAAAFNIEVARNGADRRYAFNLPQPAGQIIFLDKADKRYLILRSQKRYMELTPEMTGFEVPRAMTPGMMVEELKKQQGVTRVGEEQMNNRTVVKYRYAGTAKTGTEAGEVKGETFVYIDKETGLPMRIQAASAATGNVQGVSGGTAQMELRDIQTDVDPTLFEIPAGVNKVTEQEMKQYQSMLGTALQLLMSNMGGAMGNRGAPATPPAATMSPSPAPTAR